MQEGAKNRIVITDQGKQQLQEAYNTPIGGRGAGKGYAYGQASGPNGTRTVAERQSDLLKEGRHTRTVSAVNSKGRAGVAVAGSNARGTVLSRPDGTIVGTEISLRSANDSLANKGDMTDRMRNLSEKRQRELAERRKARIQPNQPQPAAPVNPPAPASAPKLQSSPSATPNKVGQNGKNFISKNWGRVKRLYGGTSKFGKTGQVAAIGTTALAAGALGYGAYKAIKNKKQQQQQKSFSTGNEELDLILQEVYYSGLEDGYDYAQREFSEPSGLKKYKDYDGKKMTKAQQREAIEEEDEIAEHNTGRYRRKHGWRGAGIGAGVGAVGLGLLSRAAGQPAVPGALYGGAMGGILGGAVGVSRGEKKAKKAGHDRDKRTIKLARKFDEDNASRGIESELEYQQKRDIRDRHKEELDRERNAYMAQMAYNSWR
jgi:ElaB/YqjD/DUF883 family membrane-anchored ribosome-binding protein